MSTFARKLLDLDEENRRLRAENERLRGALEMIHLCLVTVGRIVEETLQEGRQ
jgi:regulator of replication initiation timing